MNPLVKILCYIAAVVLSACLLSPPVYWGFQWLIHHGWLAALGGFPFHRYFSRIIQIAALVFAWPFIRWLNVRNLAELGLSKNNRRGSDLLAGMIIGLIPMALLAAAYLGMDVYRLRTDVAWSAFLRIIGAAVAVSVMEEFFFRGVLLGLALRVTSRLNAILGMSAVFALVHFLKPTNAITDEVTWVSGFQQMETIFSSFSTEPYLVMSALLTLVVGGIILGFCTVVTKSLWLPIGIHISWVFGEQTLNLIARYRIKPANALLPWVGPSQVSNAVPVGIWAIVALGITGLLAWWYLHERSRRTNSVAD